MAYVAAGAPAGRRGQSTLAPRPVRRSAWPAYPTRLEALARPELLARHQPSAWLSNTEMAAAASIFLTVQSPGPTVVGPSTEPTRAPVAATHPTGPLAPDAPAIVAPIFNHGEGLGRAGGVTGSPRGSLSEEEAFTVIRDELRRNGVDLTARDVPVGKLAVRVGEYRTYYDWVANRAVTRYEVSDWALLVDGLDAQKQIAVEFVSVNDYDKLDGPWRMHRIGTGYWVETLAVARSIAEQTAGRLGGVWLGVFYDPLMTSTVELDYPAFCESIKSPRSAAEFEQKWKGWEARLEHTREFDKQEAREVLKAQVRDFVDWLKAQGAI